MLPAQRGAGAEILGDAGRNHTKAPDRAIEATQVIGELVERIREMRGAKKRGEEPGFTPDELAFYDALDPAGPRCFASHLGQVPGESRSHCSKSVM